MLLGKKVLNPEKYDNSLLFRVPRSTNRAKYGITDNSLMFSGFDVWNCYEFSYLSKNGLPVQRVLKIIYSAENQYIVESKSLKLYLNSFNFETFTDENFLKALIVNDLQNLLETKVDVCIFDSTVKTENPFSDIKDDLLDLINKNDLQNADFKHYTEQPELLQGTKTDLPYSYSFHSDLLRSACPVTNQPDFGNLFVKISTNYIIDFLTVAQYLVSFRKENHFHEEIVEMIFKRFSDRFQPAKLLVSAMYTRRGGIDINPVRTSSSELVPHAFTAKNISLAKTFRQ
jgi:7-cyano-7-deazaguanine reductase